MSAHDTTEPTRRDFLYIATGMAGVVGAGAFAWPFIDQMRPDASTLAVSSIEVDVSALTPGMSLTVKWRGKPVFIRNRTPKEIEDAKNVQLSQHRRKRGHQVEAGAATCVDDVAICQWYGKGCCWG